jgi:hypothetical protein
MKTQREFYNSISSKFNIEDLGEISRYIGMDISHDVGKRILRISQQRSIEEVLENFGMNESKPRDTPMEAGYVIQRRLTDEVKTDKPYRSLIGCLMYPMLWSRPDIAFAASSMGQVSSDPSEQHWKKGIELLRYLNGTKSVSLEYKGSDSFELTGYADSDWAADKETGKSVYGYVFFVGESAVSWKSKKSQTVTATSSTAAELEGLYHAVTEGIWIMEVMQQLGVIKSGRIKIYQDNKAAIAIVKGEKHVEKTKFMIVKIEFIRDYIKSGVLEVEYLETGKMTADIFTKSLGRILLKKHMTSLGLNEKGLTENTCPDEGVCENEDKIRQEPIRRSTGVRTRGRGGHVDHSRNMKKVHWEGIG